MPSDGIPRHLSGGGSGSAHACRSPYLKLTKILVRRECDEWLLGGL